MPLLERTAAKSIREDLAYSPAAGILGPRQVGKTTLARTIAAERASTWFDLQRPADARQLAEAFRVLPALADRLVVVDEVQLMPELFGYLRPLIDEDRRPGRFLLLGSASPSLIRDASESLAGRIANSELTPMSLPEVAPAGLTLEDHLVRGGYPEPLLSLPPARRGRWYDSFLRSYVSRDLAELGHAVSESDFTRLISMLAHVHGGLFNASALARSLTVTHETVRRYVDLLERSFLVRRLLPWLPNASKRLVKSPRLYLRDSGLLHHLLGVADFRTLVGHITLGASWEGYAIEEICRAVGDAATPYFYRTAKGAEVDLVLDYRSHLVTVECKFSDAPVLTKGFYNAIEDVKPRRTYIVTPSSARYETEAGVVVIGLRELLAELSGYFAGFTS